MKINELQISKDVRDYSKPEVILARYGWKVIGYGAEGAVAEHPGKGYVLKLFKSGSKYVNFVNFVQKHQDNIHLPKFGRYVKQVPNSNFSYVRMEPLNELSETTLMVRYLPEMCSMFLIFDTFGTSLGATQLENTLIRSIGNLNWPNDEPPEWSQSQEYGYRPQSKKDVNELWKMIGKHPDREWVELCQGLKDVNASLDLHDGNFMLRGKTLIITDPFY